MKHRRKNCNKQLAQGIFSGTLAKHDCDANGIAMTISQRLYWKMAICYPYTITAAWLHSSEGQQVADKLLGYFEQGYPVAAAVDATLKELNALPLDGKLAQEYGLAPDTSYLCGILEITAKLVQG